jgi:hypothetical protein
MKASVSVHCVGEENRLPLPGLLYDFDYTGLFPFHGPCHRFFLHSKTTVKTKSLILYLFLFSYLTFPTQKKRTDSFGDSGEEGEPPWWLGLGGGVDRVYGV